MTLYQRDWLCKNECNIERRYADVLQGLLKVFSILQAV
jgi:hypothetical protein